MTARKNQQILPEKRLPERVGGFNSKAITIKFFGILLFVLIALVLYFPLMNDDAFAQETIVVSAEGLADPNADTYKRDKGLMVDALRCDAKRQVIEKAVGAFVESSTLVENYALVRDRVFTKSQGLIKRIIKETSPRLGDDGLMHLLIKAEVLLDDVKTALKIMSKENRVNLIKEHGNPTISVAVLVKDAKRGSSTPVENSTIAENILKGHFVNFGYRVWSEDYTKLLQKELNSKSSNRRVADFSVIGETKFKAASIVLKASGLTITKYILTSWTVKCINNHTGQEIYFNNKIPKNKIWTDEDQALEDIGQLIGSEFSSDFFKDHLMKPSQIFQVQMLGLPDYDTALLFKQEFIGLRPILNVDLKNYDAEGVSLFEIEFTGSGGNFAQLVNNTIINPFNAKLGQKTFSLHSYHGDVVSIAANFGSNLAKAKDKLKTMPPASLFAAAPERIRAVIKDEKIIDNIITMNPDLEQGLRSGGTGSKSGSLGDIESF